MRKQNKTFFCRLPAAGYTVPICGPCTKNNYVRHNKIYQPNKQGQTLPRASRKHARSRGMAYRLVVALCVEQKTRAKKIVSPPNTTRSERCRQPFFLLSRSANNREARVADPLSGHKIRTKNSERIDTVTRKVNLCCPPSL